eukprot:m.291039 g.291039  ORF g.291039 m.291039 type:complete len:1369 (-) comp15824_c0_seq1:350-4456(-)
MSSPTTYGHPSLSKPHNTASSEHLFSPLHKSKTMDGSTASRANGVVTQPMQVPDHLQQFQLDESSSSLSHIMTQVAQEGDAYEGSEELAMMTLPDATTIPTDDPAFYHQLDIATSEAERSVRHVRALIKSMENLVKTTEAHRKSLHDMASALTSAAEDFALTSNGTTRTEPMQTCSEIIRQLDPVFAQVSVEMEMTMKETMLSVLKRFDTLTDCKNQLLVSHVKYTSAMTKYCATSNADEAHAEDFHRRSHKAFAAKRVAHMTALDCMDLLYESLSTNKVKIMQEVLRLMLSQLSFFHSGSKTLSNHEALLSRTREMLDQVHMRAEASHLLELETLAETRERIQACHDEEVRMIPQFEKMSTNFLKRAVRSTTQTAASAAGSKKRTKSNGISSKWRRSKRRGTAKGAPGHESDEGPMDGPVMQQPQASSGPKTTDDMDNATSNVEVVLDRHGYMFMRGKDKKWRLVHLALDSQSLCQVGDTGNKTPLSHLMLATIRHGGDPRHGVFQLITPSGTLWLQALGPKEFAEWVAAINANIAIALELGNADGGDAKAISDPVKVLGGVEGNDRCADCDADDTEWASINLGVLLCIACSGVHRSLGVHISKVRSTTLDRWTDETLQFMLKIGNQKSNTYFEAQLGQLGVEKPTKQTLKAQRMDYIRRKYVTKEFADPGTPSSPADEIAASNGDPTELDASGDGLAVANYPFEGQEHDSAEGGRGTEGDDPQASQAPDEADQALKDCILESGDSFNRFQARGGETKQQHAEDDDVGQYGGHPHTFKRQGRTRLAARRDRSGSTGHQSPVVQSTGHQSGDESGRVSPWLAHSLDSVGHMARRLRHTGTRRRNRHRISDSFASGESDMDSDVASNRSSVIEGDATSSILDEQSTKPPSRLSFSANPPPPYASRRSSVQSETSELASSLQAFLFTGVGLGDLPESAPEVDEEDLDRNQSLEHTSLLSACSDTHCEGGSQHLLQVVSHQGTSQKQGSEVRHVEQNVSDDESGEHRDAEYMSIAASDAVDHLAHSAPSQQGQQAETSTNPTSQLPSQSQSHDCLQVPQSDLNLKLDTDSRNTSHTASRTSMEGVELDSFILDSDLETLVSEEKARQVNERVQDRLRPFDHQRSSQLSTQVSIHLSTPPPSSSPAPSAGAERWGSRPGTADTAAYRSGMRSGRPSSSQTQPYAQHSDSSLGLTSPTTAFPSTAPKVMPRRKAPLPTPTQAPQTSTPTHPDQPLRASPAIMGLKPANQRPGSPSPSSLYSKLLSESRKFERAQDQETDDDTSGGPVPRQRSKSAHTRPAVMARGDLMDAELKMKLARRFNKLGEKDPLSTQASSSSLFSASGGDNADTLPKPKRKSSRMMLALHLERRDSAV